MVAMHCLILDRVEAINEDQGYLAGDAVLRAAAERIDRLIGGETGMFAARLGGVEFAIVQPGLFQPRHAELFAAEIVEAIARAYVVAGQELRIGAHVGYAFALQQDADLDRLMKNAVDAAHRARREARDTAGHLAGRWTATAGRG
jgi:diguanylate cyclase (GGDEF)-like protein